MAPVLFDGPGADTPEALLAEARAFLDAAGHAGGGGLRRCARVLIARSDPHGPVIAVVAGQRLTAVDGQRPVSCLVIQQLCLGARWATHGPLVRCMATELLRSPLDTVLLWVAPTAGAHAAASRTLPGLLPRFGERLPGASAAVRDRVMARVDPHGWDPLRGSICLRGTAGVPSTRHVCMLRSSPAALARMAHRTVLAAFVEPAPRALPVAA